MQTTTLKNMPCAVSMKNAKAENDELKEITLSVPKVPTTIRDMNKLTTLTGKMHTLSGGAVNNSVSTRSYARRPKRCFAIDCEMVGVGPKNLSVVARVSIVDLHGNCMFDSFVKIEERVTDYRTAFSGIRPEDLQSKKAQPFGVVRSKVRKILHGCILVGHGLCNDLKSLNLFKCAYSIRDTTEYIPFLKQCWDGTYRPRRLRDLIWDNFGRVIQDGEHSSIEDAAAAMSLYILVKEEWDSCFGYDNEFCLPYTSQHTYHCQPLASRGWSHIGTQA